MGKGGRKRRVESATAAGGATGESGHAVERTPVSRSHLAGILGIVVLGLAVYANAFSVPFMFDDIPNIVNRAAIRQLSNFNSLSGEIGSIIYIRTRFISHLSFALNYAMNGLNATGYHLFNITVHILNALLVYRLVMLSLKTPGMRHFRTEFGPEPSGSERARRYGNMIALAGALLFVCHPVETQAVTYITQRFASLATLFYLLAVVLYVQARIEDGIKEGPQKDGARNAGLSRFRRPALYVLSLTAVVVAMKTKEISFTVPIMLALYEVMFFEGPARRRLPALLPFFGTLAIIPLAMLGAAQPAGSLTGEVSEAARSLSSVSRADYLFTQFRVIATYMRLLLFPVNQNVDYDYPVYHSLLSPAAFLPLLLLTAVLGFGVFIYLRYRNTAPLSRLISFGIFWFFIALSVESSIIPITDIIFEHRVYLPSVGFFLAAAAAMVSVKIRLDKERPGWGRPAVGAFAVIVLFLSLAAHMRNRVWQDEANFWKDGVKKSPGKARIHNNLGFSYRAMGRIDEAIGELKTAIRLEPDYPEAHNNLGTAYDDKRLTDEAIAEYKTAIRLKPDYAEPHNNLGAAYESKGLSDEAIAEYETAFRLKPGYVEPLFNIACAYEAKGMTDKAIEQYHAALRMNPDYKEAHNNLGMAYASKGLSDKAIEEYKIALRLKPDYAEARNNLGKAYASTGLVDLAIIEFQEALRVKPAFAEARNNLGNIYALKGKWDRAKAEFREALRVKPDFAGAHYNLGAVYLKTGDPGSARKEFETALKLQPDLGQARKMLNEMGSPKH